MAHDGPRPPPTRIRRGRIHPGASVNRRPAPRTGAPAISGVQRQLSLFVRYLRSKPGRGLAIIYNAGALNGSRGKRTNILDRWVTVTLPEALLAGTRVRFSARQVQEAALGVPRPGILTTDGGLVVQVFPADHGLPALDESCAPAPGGPLFSALETAARIQLSDPSWQLASAKAEPVRYKPSSRCVIRYRLMLERGTREGILQQDLTLFAKLYSDPDQARRSRLRWRTLHGRATRMHRDKNVPEKPRSYESLKIIHRNNLRNP